MIALALTRPRLVPELTTAIGVLVAVYVALIVTTIIFASLQTHLAQEMQEKRMEIAKLENAYYASVAALDESDPLALGYVTPTKVQYLTQSTLPNLTFARN